MIPSVFLHVVFVAYSFEFTVNLHSYTCISYNLCYNINKVDIKGHIKLLKELKRIISNSCICFTIIEFIILTVAQIMLEAEAKNDTFVSFLGLGSAAILFAAVFLQCFLSIVFKIKSLPGFVVRIIHYLLSSLSLFLIFVVIPGNFNVRFVFVFIVLYSVFYIIASLIKYAIDKAMAKHSETHEEYSPVYENIKK